MPTWNEDELLCINQFASDWFNNFVTFGGVPRHVFWNGIDNDPRKLLSHALDTKGGHLARNFFTFGLGDVDPDMSFMLVHINPRENYNSHTWSYIGEPVYSFASDEIFVMIEKKYESALLAQALQIFNAGVASDTYGSVSAGHLFEKVCLYSAPLAEKSIHVTFFDKTIPSCCYNLPAIEVLPDNWKSSATLKDNLLYRPRISNLESGDAFAVIRDEVHPELWVLIVLQITVGKSHPVKSNGLVRIFNSFLPEIRTKIASKILVFVTPNHGQLNSEQPLVTIAGEENKQPPLIARDFQQCFYRYSLTKQTSVVSTSAHDDEMEY
jgi:hypothetical protein